MLRNLLAVVLIFSLAPVYAQQVWIERFNLSEVDVSLDGIDYHDTYEVAKFGELPIPVLEINDEYLQVEMKEGGLIWIMESDVTTSEFNDVKKNCLIARVGDVTSSDQGAVRGVDNSCQK